MNKIRNVSRCAIHWVKQRRHENEKYTNNNKSNNNSKKKKRHLSQESTKVQEKNEMKTKCTNQHIIYISHQPID